MGTLEGDGVRFAISGASGGIGGRVASRLSARGHELRLICRDGSRAPELPGAELALAEYGDAAAMVRALDGVETFFMVSAGEATDRVRRHLAAVDAAVEAGVERIVYLSFVNAAPEATFTFARDHWYTEERVRASGLRFTFLRDNLYLDYLPFMAGADGVIRGPAGEGRVGAVARDDIAEAAATVLLGDDHDGRTYDITGPEALTLHEAAAEVSRAAGRPVTYRAESIEEAYASRASFGAPAFEVEGWVTSYVAIAEGQMDVLGDAIYRLTGHEPMTLAEFLRRNPDSYAHLRLDA